MKFHASFKICQLEKIHTHTQSGYYKAHDFCFLQFFFVSFCLFMFVFIWKGSIIKYKFYKIPPSNLSKNQTDHLFIYQLLPDTIIDSRVQLLFLQWPSHGYYYSAHHTSFIKHPITRKSLRSTHHAIIQFCVNVVISATISATTVVTMMPHSWHPL